MLDVSLFFSIQKEAFTLCGLAAPVQAKFPGHASFWEWLPSLLPIQQLYNWETSKRRKATCSSADCSQRDRSCSFTKCVVCHSDAVFKGKSNWSDIHIQKMRHQLICVTLQAPLTLTDHTDLEIYFDHEL